LKGKFSHTEAITAMVSFHDTGRTRRSFFRMSRDADRYFFVKKGRLLIGALCNQP